MARSYTGIVDGYGSKLLILRSVRVLARDRGKCVRGSPRAQMATRVARLDAEL
jgi:hypothetical protein